MEDEIEVGATPEVENEIAAETQSMDETIRQTLDKIQSREGRPRDESGRFAKVAEPEETTPPVETEATSSPSEAPPVTAPEEKFEVPQELQRLGLRKEEAKAFMEAPEILRTAFMRRSDEMHKGLENFRESAVFGQAIQKAIDPFRATIQSLGVQPEQAIQSLFVADHKLRYGSPEDKARTFQNLAKEYGVDLNLAQPDQDEWVDPNVSALQNQLRQLQEQIYAREQAERMRESENLQSEIQRFASDPAHAHFEAVKTHMSALLQSGVAKDLQDAYDQAIYANPTIRTQVLAQQQAETEAKRKAELAHKAQEAKKAAAVNLPKKGSVAPAGKIGSMDDTIRAELVRLGMIQA